MADRDVFLPVPGWGKGRYSSLCSDDELLDDDNEPISNRQSSWQDYGLSTLQESVYLPVTGRVLAQSPRDGPSPVLKMGWLDKNPPQGSLYYQRRWVKLDVDYLRYFDNDKEVYSKRIIPTSAITGVTNVGEQKFEVVTTNRTFLFRAESDFERNEWVSVLQNFTMGGQEGSREITSSVPHSSMTPGSPLTPEQQGYLELRGLRSKLYTVVSGDKVFLYKNMEDYRLGIGITSIDMNVGNVKDTDRRSFDLTTPYRIFSFLADSEQHKDQWVEAMREAIGEALSNSEVANQIWAEPSNGCCADCGAAKPEWAAINLCVVVCKRCAGEHRGLGPSISKVRSLKMDRRVWTEELIQVHTHLSLTLSPSRSLSLSLSLSLSYDHTFELYSDSERIYLFGTDDPDSHREWVKSITKTFIPSNAEGLLRLAFERIGRLRYKDGLNLQSPRVGWFALVGSSLHAYLEDSVEEEEIHLRKLQELSIQQENEVLVLVERGRWERAVWRYAIKHAWLCVCCLSVIPEESRKICQYQLLLSQLPRVNKATLRALVNHLYCVQRFAELNQMNLHNLAIVFGPTLFQSDGKDYTAGLVVEELIEHYTDVFEVDELQLKRQLDEITAIIKVREKLNHNSSVPASGSAGDFICTVYLEEKKETTEQHVKIPGSMTAAELTCEILDRRKIQVREKDYWSCWEVSEKEETERPLHHLERVLPIIHSLGTDSHLLVKKHLAMEAIRIYLASKVDVSKHGMVKFREERSILGLGLHTGSFHDRYFILSTASLRMYKEVRSNRPEREWQVKNLRVYLGIKKKLRPPTCWGLTVINGSEKQEKPERQQWYLCCDTQTEMREWFSTFLTIQYDGNVWPADAVQTRVTRALPADTRHGNVALIPLRGSENEMRNSVAAFTADPLGLFRDV
nr:arf-GAP with Rho-GAP domain, ANK repeat and PH domain-containing protein 1-like [Oncorhynchus nerka]